MTALCYLGVSEDIWTEVVQNHEDDMPYTFDETTPLKACGGDFAYNVPMNGTDLQNDFYFPHFYAFSLI